MSDRTPEQARSAQTIVWRDIWYTLVWGGVREGLESSTTWMNWTLYAIAAEEWDSLGDPTATTGRVFYEKRGARSSMELTEDLAEAEPLAHGFIKWDGCMQWWWDATLMHVDDRQDIRHMAEAFERIRDEMRKIDDGEIEGR